MLSNLRRVPVGVPLRGGLIKVLTVLWIAVEDAQVGKPR